MKGQKLTIDDLREMARKKGGECLSEVYINAHTKYRWRCHEGHEWEAIANSIKHGSWCRICLGDRLRGNIKELHHVAEGRGGKCLSDEYITAHTKYRWRCHEGHEWEAKADSIKQGSWCRICSIKKVAEQQRGDINELHRIAEERDGKCLSEAYTNSRAKYRWRCHEGHEWEAEADSIKQGRWCRICSIKKVAEQQRGDINELHRIAEERDGKCLSEAYANSKTKYRWRCHEGHEWEAEANSIKQGRWCRICSMKKAGERRRVGVEELYRIAEELGGNCLSDEYITAHTKYRWRCHEGHEWEANANSVQQGRWCPSCSSARGEKLATEILNQTDHKFSKNRPDWLLYSRGKSLELDCFCQSRAIALEYQGQQHFEELPFFHRKAGDFKDQQERDEFKRQRCAENKVLLFEVRAVINPTPERIFVALAAAVQELAIPLEINPEYRQMLEEHGLAYYPTQDDQKAA